MNREAAPASRELSTRCADHPLISVIVCTTGDRESLQGTIASLQAQSCSHFEILLVFNCENLPATAYGESVRVLHEPRRGLCRARNCGIRAARGEIVFFTDDDILAQCDWLHAMQAGFSDPAVGCVTGSVRLPNDGYLLQKWSQTDRFLSEWILSPTVPDWYEQALRFDTGWGCNMAFRRSVLSQIGVFPENLGLGSDIGGADETWMFLEVLKHGWAIRHQPQAAVTLLLSPKRADSEQRAKSALTCTTSFHLKLLVEDSGFRLALLRKLLRSARGYMVRGSAISERDIPLAFSSKLRAYAAGIPAYWRSRRLQQSRSVGAVRQ